MVKRSEFLKKANIVFISALIVSTLSACGDNSGGNTTEPVGNVVDTEKDTTNESDENTTIDEGEKSDVTDSEAEDENTNETVTSDDAEPGEIVELEQNYSAVSEDELKWEYDYATKTIVISGIGPMKDYSENVPEWDEYCEKTEKVIIGDEVTSVGAYAFYMFSDLKEIQLGETVEYIGEGAFCNCHCLEKVNFPSTLKYVGDVAFQNALLHSDTGFKLPEGLLKIGNYAFYSAFKEGTVTIPSTVMSIGDHALSNIYVEGITVDENNQYYTSIDGVLYDKDISTLIHYPALKQDTLFEIPETVTTILNEAIEVTNTLEKIVIPASVSSIEEGSIYWNYGLAYIEVDEANSCYKSQDDVLFTKDGKILLCYPIASDKTEYTVPEGTERIGNYAMSQAGNLTELHIKEGLKEIGDTSLYSCNNLQTIGLPKSLVNIDNKALTYCESLTEIRYAGSSEDWDKIVMGEENEILNNGIVNIYCAE